MSDIYSAPSADLSMPGDEDETYTPKMFSLKGRIGRCRMLAYQMGTLLLAMVAMGVLTALTFGNTSNVLYPVLMMILYIPIMLSSFVFSIRRLNDLDQSGWLCLLSLVPLVNAFFGLYLLFAPGTQGRNSYGPAPGPNTGLIIAGALVLPAIAIIGFMAAMMIGMWGGLFNMRG